MPRISNKAEFWQGLILISDTQGLNLIMGSVVDSDGYTARCQGSMLGSRHTSKLCRPCLTEAHKSIKFFKTSVLFLRQVGFFSFRLASFVFLADAESSSWRLKRAASHPRVIKMWRTFCVTSSRLGSSSWRIWIYRSLGLLDGLSKSLLGT